ncbi:MAG: hypothetical protein D6705_07870 [Deltaproteobacteria bacterium]|nr:MAG: hypothetical protein D6705_07870 [Deltaproteobacteria bacterium]
MQVLAFIAAALAYGAAAVLFAVASEPRDPKVRWARLVLGLAAALHLVLVGSRCTEGRDPLSSVYLAVDLMGGLVALGYLGLSARGRLAGFGPAAGSLALLGLCLGMVFDVGELPRLPARATLAHAHVLFAVLGVAGFALASLVAAAYLGLERRLRTKRFRPGSTPTSLAGLERLYVRLLLLVAPIFTLAIVTGVLWVTDAAHRTGRPPGDLLVQRRLELSLAMGAWVATVLVLVARGSFGVRGRRAAHLTLLSFAAVLAVLASYGIRS